MNDSTGRQGEYAILMFVIDNDRYGIEPDDMSPGTWREASLKLVAARLNKLMGPRVRAYIRRGRRGRWTTRW